MLTNGYDLLAEEYYDNSHKTCRNFDLATRQALMGLKEKVPTAGIILEVGCGRGRAHEFLGLPGDRVVQLDSSRNMLALNQREASALRLHADATQMPIFDGQVTGVIGFLIDPFVGLNFFAEAFRVLSSDGIFIATTPSAEWGLALRGNKEREALTAKFIDKAKNLIEVPSSLLSAEKIKTMLEHIGFKRVSVTSHVLPPSVVEISPDIERACAVSGKSLSQMPILYLISAAKP